jgi:hypothetical protein
MEGGIAGRQIEGSSETIENAHVVGTRDADR